jgi:drug/metabolite transporter (DMT)-like permease
MLQRFIADLHWQARNLCPRRQFMLPVTALVLFAAALHASWNALLRGGADRLWSMTIMNVTSAAFCGAGALVVTSPEKASWPYIITSGFLHVGYSLFLVRTYRSGDLGQTYPIARGSSPVLVTAGAAVFAGEIPGPLGILGMLLVSGGIVSLAFERRQPSSAILPYALITGAFIGAYSVTDGIGVRLSGNAVAYTVWMELVAGLLFPLIYIYRRHWRSLLRGHAETAVAAGGGLISTIGYGIVIFAMSLGPMGSVSALRETSVVFAAVLGAIFLHETLTIYRLVACIIIAAGAICISI